MEVAKKIIKKLFPIHTKEILIVLGLLFVLLLTQLFDEANSQEVDRINRPSYFSGDKEITLYYEKKELNIKQEPVTFHIDKLQASKEEISQYMESVSKVIQDDLISQYDSYKQITGPISYPERVEECRISYSFEPSKYINNYGWMDSEIWDEEVVIQINYTIKFDGTNLVKSMEIPISKNGFTKEYEKAYLEYRLQEEVSMMNETYDGEGIILPDQVTFYNAKKLDSIGYLIILWLSIVISFSLITYYEIGLRKAEDYTKRKVELTYFINSFTLLYQTGMTMQKSFLVTVNNRLLVLDDKEQVYMDLAKIRTLIESGEKFHEVVKSFISYFNIREGRRFSRMLLQTLKQGDDHLVNQLEYMTRLLWEERIRIARKESERASSKLVFPMLLIFIVILIISIVPTFLEVQSLF